ncbi:MAG: B12-binding domain-containing radical SAM protein, partial [Candidatus Omnitrophica bacterium]|nr:B12-binding domain-containing radical SAM protein [Candidatus Omnitrophota bacterium]
MIKRSKLNIILIQPPVWGVYEPPVGLAQLVSYLKLKGYRVKCFDINIDLYNNRTDEYKNVWANEQTSFWCNENNVKEFFSSNLKYIEGYVDRILDLKPDIVGFSVNVASIYATKELTKMLKKIEPKIKVVVGGPLFFVEQDFNSILDDSLFDIIILREAEETFVKLLEFIKNNKDLTQCEGICFKENGKIIKTKERPLIKNLDILPFLDFEDLHLEKYDPPGHLGKHISLMTSRGCIMSCVFCGPRAYWQGYRTMSAKRIYEEIKYHLENHPEIEHVEFLDLLFNGDMKVLEEFCDLMINKPLKKKLGWHANMVIRQEISKDLCKKMKEAGCKHLTFGIESGSQKILDLMRKKYKIDDANKVLKNVHDAGITVTCNFMFGFPSETEDDFQKTLDFIKKNIKYIDFAYPSRSFCTIEPYSYLEKHLDEFGIIPNPINNLYWESKD